MANSSVFTGADGSITLSVPAGTEGEKANAILESGDLISVGRVTNVRVEVSSKLKAYHEIGQRYPSELRPGNITITGTIGRAYINGSLLRLLLGEGADSKPAASWVQPAFNISLMVSNPADAAARNTLTLHNVKLANWVYEIPEDDFLMESVSFMAINATVQDEP